MGDARRIGCLHTHQQVAALDLQTTQRLRVGGTPETENIRCHLGDGVHPRRERHANEADTLCGFQSRDQAIPASLSF